MDMLPELLFLFAGILLGGLLVWLFLKLRFAGSYVSQSEVASNYVRSEIVEDVRQNLDLARDELRDKDQSLQQLNGELGTLRADLKNLHERLENASREREQLRQRNELEFKELANRLLDEKTEKFTAHNRHQMEALLEPLRLKMKDFGEGIEQKLVDDAKDKLALKLQIQQLTELNQQLSDGANNLAEALKGSSKTQGDWGEFRLETILERAGLSKNVHFFSQNSYKDHDGREKRPDFVIQLPDEKHLIIDSKVSLTAYERCFNATEESERRKHLSDHVASLRKHVKDLNGKNYTQLYQIHSPDYLLLFVPLENAFALAMQEDDRLFLDALDKNIVIVTTSTLLATMRTVSFIWRQDKQQKSVLEIARESGLLYDKFVGFVNDMKDIGQRIQQTQTSYDRAMNKLHNASRPGSTLVGKAEKIRELGARTNKQLPQDL